MKVRFVPVRQRVRLSTASTSSGAGSRSRAVFRMALAMAITSPEAMPWPLASPTTSARRPPGGLGVLAVLAGEDVVGPARVAVEQAPHVPGVEPVGVLADEGVQALDGAGRGASHSFLDTWGRVAGLDTVEMRDRIRVVPHH